jgi:hypothetical protein
MRQRTVLARLFLWLWPSDLLLAPSHVPAPQPTFARDPESDLRRRLVRLRSGSSTRPQCECTPLMSHVLQVGDYATRNAHDGGWRRAEVVVPPSCCCGPPLGHCNRSGSMNNRMCIVWSNSATPPLACETLQTDSTKDP